MIKRIIGTFSRGKLIFLMLAGILIYQSFGSFIVSLKPAKTFEEVAEGGAAAGDHIAGEVLYLLDYFAAEQSWKQNSNGSMTPKETSAYYYVVPADQSYMGIRMRAEDMKAAEKLVEETYAFMSGENQPTARMEYEGEVVKMEEEYPEMVELFHEELLYYGYSEEEIEAMGELLVLERRDFMAVRGMFVGGIAVLLLVALRIGAEVHKANRWAKAKEEEEVIAVKRQGENRY